MFLTKVKPGVLQEKGSWGRSEEPTLGSAGRAAQRQPKQPSAEDHVARGDGPASARRRAARAFKQELPPRSPAFPV